MQESTNTEINKRVNQQTGRITWLIPGLSGPASTLQKLPPPTKQKSHAQFGMVPLLPHYDLLFGAKILVIIAIDGGELMKEKGKGCKTRPLDQKGDCCC